MRRRSREGGFSVAVRRRGGPVRRGTLGRAVLFVERSDVDRHTDAPARIIRQARHELAPTVAVAHVVSDGDLAHFADGAATLDVARHRHALHLDRLAGRAALVALDLVADDAADDRARRGAAVAAAAAAAELVADDAARDRAQDGA